MNLPLDIIIAAEDQFEPILADIKNSLSLDVTPDVGVSIDDVVTIIALHRDAIDDRQAWWKLRREAYARFQSHSEVTTRTVALVPNDLRDSIAEFDTATVAAIAGDWVTQDTATPTSVELATTSLQSFVEACSQAVAASKCILIRTSQLPNAFEVAFSQLNGKEVKPYQRAFDKWDEIKRHEAHQRFKYYENQGHHDALKLVLRDFSRPKTSKVNLKTDQRKIQRHLVKRIKAYAKSPEPGSGDPADPVTLITLTFDIEYEGYVDLIFSTRPNPTDDLSWEERTDECLDFFHWNEGLQRFGCDGKPLKMTLHDGSQVVIPPDADDDIYADYIGEMLKDTMITARDSGEFAKLPLADDCVMWVGGTHVNYSWPEIENLATEGRVS